MFTSPPLRGLDITAAAGSLPCRRGLGPVALWTGTPIDCDNRPAASCRGAAKRHTLCMPTTNDTRTAFLDYFARHDHAIVPSGPLVPRNDPTLLFTNAG